MALLLLLLGAFLLEMYFWRQDAFLLNRTVRLVSFRMLRYEELALHRRYLYRIQFFADHCRVDARPLKPGREWRQIAVFPYEKGVRTTMPGFTVEIDRGQIVSFYWGGKSDHRRSYLILPFFHQKRPSKQRGIEYMENGSWRVLKGWDADSHG